MENNINEKIEYLEGLLSRYSDSDIKKVLERYPVMLRTGVSGYEKKDQDIYNLLFQIDVYKKEMNIGDWVKQFSENLNIKKIEQGSNLTYDSLFKSILDNEIRSSKSPYTQKYPRNDCSSFVSEMMTHPHIIDKIVKDNILNEDQKKTFISNMNSIFPSGSTCVTQSSNIEKLLKLSDNKAVTSKEDILAKIKNGESAVLYFEKYDGSRHTLLLVEGRMYHCSKGMYKDVGDREGQISSGRSSVNAEQYIESIFKQKGIVSESIKAYGTDEIYNNSLELAKKGIDLKSVEGKNYKISPYENNPQLYKQMLYSNFTDLIKHENDPDFTERVIVTYEKVKNLAQINPNMNQQDKFKELLSIPPVDVNRDRSNEIFDKLDKIMLKAHLSNANINNIPGQKIDNILKEKSQYIPNDIPDKKTNFIEIILKVLEEYSKTNTNNNLDNPIKKDTMDIKAKDIKSDLYENFSRDILDISNKIIAKDPNSDKELKWVNFYNYDDRLRDDERLRSKLSDVKLSVISANEDLKRRLEGNIDYKEYSDKIEKINKDTKDIFIKYYQGDISKEDFKNEYKKLLDNSFKEYISASNIDKKNTHEEKEIKKESVNSRDSIKDILLKICNEKIGLIAYDIDVNPHKYTNILKDDLKEDVKHVKKLIPSVLSDFIKEHDISDKFDEKMLKDKLENIVLSYNRGDLDGNSLKESLFKMFKDTEYKIPKQELSDNKGVVGNLEYKIETIVNNLDKKDKENIKKENSLASIPIIPKNLEIIDI